MVEEGKARRQASREGRGAMAAGELGRGRQASREGRGALAAGGRQSAPAQ